MACFTAIYKTNFSSKDFIIISVHML